MKILIADDDPIARTVLAASLRLLGHESVAAGDGAEAWEIFGRERLRVVVSDWMMPGIDGLELCRRIRAANGDYVYYILLTNLTDSNENMQAAIDAGVDDFLRKPVDRFDLGMRLRVAQRILEFTHQVQRLEAFLPICSYCKKIRDDQNYWQRIESYINERTGSQFSHSICPDCVEGVVKPQLRKLGLDLPPGAPLPGTGDRPPAPRVDRVPPPTDRA